MAEQIVIENGEFEDWRGSNADPGHGGVTAASIACVVEVLENMVVLSNGTNFVSYFLNSMLYSAAESANMVTNFMGASFLLTIFGGFVSDSFLTRFNTFIIFCTLELSGLILLTIQAQNSRLLPAINSKPSKTQEAILYTGLYAIAAGVGGVKATLPAHGADQLNHNNQRLISSFFNWFFFSLCFGGLIASTVMIWIEENLGWNLSFKISLVTLSVALCIFAMGFPIYRYKHPGGSPLTRIYNVFASSIGNRKTSLPEAEGTQIYGEKGNHDKLMFLNKALIGDSITATDVEETKTFLGLLPIFASTIMMNCCLAQLTTFSVQQGNIMDRSLNNFKIPTQSLRRSLYSSLLDSGCVGYVDARKNALILLLGGSGQHAEYVHRVLLVLDVDGVLHQLGAGIGMQLGERRFRERMAGRKGSEPYTLGSVLHPPLHP
ncbi:Protein NRT1/ PTR FAMILY 4.1 [Hibiscus syriacus]|uniref:Protein NRT1/ PTR FAMILY 4.1 n=1 Tax=Hibiscus syriacus TaxID=106335 RepID=A0A6A3ACB3_HIBSY|nr:Protein NRT1/ PTR FAMILY 4.1 [Hibiscus syriacus]